MGTETYAQRVYRELLRSLFTGKADDTAECLEALSYILNVPSNLLLENLKLGRNSEPV
jgi:hypothetical protein